MREIYLGLTNHPGQLSLAIRPWVGAMGTGQTPKGGDALLMGVKAVRMARVWWQVKLCEPFVQHVSK